MKRSFASSLNSSDGDDHPTHKVALVERNSSPGGVALVNPRRVAKKTPEELMELEQSLDYADTFVQANAMNKLDVIGREMKHLHELMIDIVKDTQCSNELNHVACNFVKRPGHIYHLYERPSGQKYFSMLSPEEWMNAPHKFLGSFRLEVDQSWTPANEIEFKYAGLDFLRNRYSGSIETKMILSSSS